MGHDISEVLVGVATLFIREPNDARAEWSTLQKQTGDYSVKLYKDGAGNEGSTHVQFTPVAGTTMAAWTLAVATNNFWHHCSAVLGNFTQFEFRFEDPNSDAWAEITAVPLQTYLGTGAWVQTTLANATPCGYGGVGELGASFFNWGPLTNANLVEGAILLDPAVTDPSDWLLTRIRLELWEATPLRTCYIDTVTVMGVTYAIEPGATTPALSLSSPFVEVGYTEDGVTVTYNATGVPIRVNEETFPIAWALSEESAEITCNLAQSSLDNLNKAMAGAVLSGNILTLGGGVQKYMNIKIEGLTPDGYLVSIMAPRVVATGTVGRKFMKGEKTVVPLTLQVLKPAGEPAVTIVYNAA